MSAPAPTLEERVNTLETTVLALAATDISDHSAEDSTDAAVTRLLLSLQSQFLWVCCAMLLIGAGAGYILTKTFDLGGA